MIRIINRQWNKANLRKQEVRPEWFSYEKCFEKLYDVDTVDLHVLIDGTRENHHFEIDGGFYYSNFNLTEFEGGSDANSFMFALDYVKKQNFDDEDIIYFVEDDYLHVEGWEEILQNVFDNFNIDYVTLYDHPDKYFAPMYKNLEASLLVTDKCHWRTTPSTCNTYAGKWKTFKKHWDIHYKFCLPEYTHDGYDHTKFITLWQNGSNLISPIPSVSTHCEKDFLAPLIDWKNV
jgi:hypothetical protein